MTLLTPQIRCARYLQRICLPLLLAAGATLAAVATQASRAAPASPQVVNGQASFAQQGNVFSITNTPNTIINWQSFSIGAGDITRFIQQDGNSAVLNRIVGQDPSRILGALQSNGHVFLINPNGILFGRDARIDVNGLTASTLNLTNADFLAGKRHFAAAAGATPGAILNQGSITTPGGGHVFLIAPNVENSGIITSPQGEVVLAAGHSVQLVDSANPDLHVVVSAPASQALNLGQVIAQGGKVGIYGALVRQRGLVSADSARVGENGQIVFKASADALLEAGSVTSASGASGAGKGGQISVQGERVGMTGNARIDASGAAGGGTVLLGGGYQGRNPLLRNARQTLMGKDASIRADASGGAGDGGTVVLWSDGATRAFGSISAQGGTTAGKGGLVETSGHYLNVHGIRVKTGRRAGSGAGTWLLDPFDVTIGANGSTDLLSSVDEFSDTPADTMTLIDADKLNQAAPDSNIVIQARHDVLVNGAIARTGGTTGSLGIEAGNNITVDADISSSGGALSLSANSAPYASGSGTVAVNAALRTGGGALSLSGNSVVFGAGNPALANTGGGNIAINAANAFRLAANSTLQSGGRIDIVADQISMPGGMIGPASTQRPTVSIAPADRNRDIEIAGGVQVPELLRLSPFDLNPIQAQELIIGGMEYNGKISVLAALGGAATPAETTVLRLQGQNTIAVNAPITLKPGNGSTLALERFGGMQGLIGTGSSGALSADNLLLRSDNMTIGAAIIGTNSTGGTGGNVLLAPGHGITKIQLGANAADAVDQLGLSDIELRRISTRRLSIGDPATQSALISVIGALDLSASLGADSKLILTAGSGGIDLAQAVTTPGALQLSGANIGNVSGAPARAGAIILNASGQIGGGGASPTPFYTETAYLSAINTVASGNGPINISNVGTLNLGNVSQGGGANSGAISIVNQGGMTLLKDEPASATPVAVRSKGGPIVLTTFSPLTINGGVDSNGGAIGLQAGNGGVLTIGATGSVASGAGNIALTGGAIVNNGSVSAGAGNIVLSAATFSGSGTLSSASGVVSGVPVNPPTVGECIKTPTLAACASVLAQALDNCIVNPGLAYCPAVLPSLSTCTAAPATLGCSVVLPGLAQCISAPSTAGCSAVLPSLELCAAAPSTPGCPAVLPSLAVCTAAPSTPGCASVLPSLNLCTSAPATAGCSAVLPSIEICSVTPAAPGCTAVLPALALCVSAPATAGCGAVLPSLAVCSAAPATAGCSAVLPSILVCSATPSAPGCAAVLPSLASCVSAPATAGCGAVLPSLAVCSAAPATAGCSAVLPSIQVCSATPAAPGCAAVLPSLALCSAAPATAGCSAVLPSIQVCSATPAAPGCAVVLPSLASCIVAPGTAGCSVVLPALSACLATPSRAGCNAVLPSLASCAANPAQAGCGVVLPTLAACSVNPGLSGCAAVLPTLAQCISSTSLAGCGAVLPSLASCVANPATPGCTAVLPPLSQCVANPAAAGCTVVLPTLAQCVANPAATGCNAVLPSLQSCVANPRAAGCLAVLPTLAQCSAAPSLAACGAVLPSLAQCTAAPTLAGCAVVLPPVNSCVANPTLPGCTVVVPPTQLASDGAIKEVIVNTVNVINTVRPGPATPGSGSGAGPVAAPAGKVEEKIDDKKETNKESMAPSGEAKVNELPKKMYCN